MWDHLCTKRHTAPTDNDQSAESTSLIRHSTISNPISLGLLNWIKVLDSFELVLQ